MPCVCVLARISDVTGGGTDLLLDPCPGPFRGRSSPWRSCHHDGEGGVRGRPSRAVQTRFFLTPKPLVCPQPTCVPFAIGPVFCAPSLALPTSASSPYTSVPRRFQMECSCPRTPVRPAPGCTGCRQAVTRHGLDSPVSSCGWVLGDFQWQRA